MLKKLLSYDFIAIFKYWWIGALTTIVLALVGAGCGTILQTEKDLPDGVTVFATIGMVLVVLGLLAFIIFSQLLVYVRFYKHLFTDEGYLTFTLPVKRHHILTSKLVSGFVCGLLTVFLTIADAVIIIFTTFRKDIFYEGWYENFIKGIKDIISAVGAGNLTILIIEVLITGILILALSILFTYLCITFAGAISKKSKLSSAILMYYGASSISSIFMYFLYFFGIDAISEWMYDFETKASFELSIIIILLVIFFVAMLCTIAYTINYRLLDSKLNLN